MPQRCALGCQWESRITRHQFPHPERNPERFKAWVSLVGGKLKRVADYEVYRKKVICDVHFRDSDKNRNNRLNFMAVPTLHLPGSLSDVSIIEGDLKPIVSGAPPTTSLTETGSLSEVSMKDEDPMPTVSGLQLTSSLAETEKPERRKSQKESAKKVKKPLRLKLVSSLFLEKLKLSRRRVKDLQIEIKKLCRRNKKLQERLAKSDRTSTRMLLTKNTKYGKKPQKCIVLNNVSPSVVRKPSGPLL